MIYILPFDNVVYHIVEKEMATHSSTVAWRIPWMEEPGGYSPWSHQELDNDWVTEHAAVPSAKVKFAIMSRPSPEFI